MATKIENSSPATKEAIKNAVGGWREAQKIDITVNTPDIIFNVPATARIARIQGLIVSPTGLINPGLTINGLTTAIYNSLRVDTTASGDQAPTIVNNGNNIAFTSLFGNSEESLIDIQIPISNGVTRQLVKSVCFNNGGSDGDYHTCVGFAASASDVTTIELTTISPFSNGYEAGSFFTLTVLE